MNLDADRRLRELRSRWNTGRSARAFAQLGDELRRRERLDEAVQVLDEGLAEHPGYAPGQLALARCKLLRQEASQAVEILEAVLTKDPAHLVASRLMIEALLQAGSTDRARHQLEQYSLLNPSDPEIENLRSQLEGSREPSSDDILPMDDDEAPGEGDVADAVGASPGPSLVDADETDDEPEAEVASGQEDVMVDSEPSKARVVAGRDDPFPGLGEPEAIRQFEEGLGGEGIFTMPRRPKPAPTPEPEPEPAPEPAAEPEAIAPEVDAAEPATAEETADALDVAASVEEPLEAARESIESTTPEAVVPAQEEAELGVETPGTEETPAESVAEASDPPETATLGRLYLGQGHLDEAERIFRAVLDRDASHAGALEGLAEVQRRRRPLAAADLLTGDEAEGSVHQRKVSVLRRYLSVLRGGR